MDKIWKWIMRLNAKAFCLVAALFFAGVAGFCAWQYTHPPAPLQDGRGGRPPEALPAWAIGTLDFVTNQLTAETLVLPMDPFKPTIEAIFTNEVERAAFLKTLKAVQASAAGIAGSTAGAAEAKKDPFAHLRKKASVPGGLVDSEGKPLVVPKIYFEGFLQRPDGTRVAMFRDSIENTTVFYEPGKKVHGVEILSADVNEAELRLPDGTTRKLKIGGDPVELAPEPAKAPPKKIAPVKPGAASAVKPGVKGPVAAAKPGVKGAAAANPGKAQQKPAAQNQKAAQQKRNRK